MFAFNHDISAEFQRENPGLTRIITGHALMFEHDALQIRINQFLGRIERQICQKIICDGKIDEDNGFTGNEHILANQLLVFCEGIITQCVRSKFNYLPTLISLVNGHYLLDSLM